MLLTTCIRLGLVHGSLAARSKWPNTLNNGQELEWTALDEIPESPDVDVWILGTHGLVKDRLKTFHRLREKSPLDIPILVLLNPREEQGPWLSVRADGFHETSSSAALMAQRIQSLLPFPEKRIHQNHNVGNALAMEESDHWQATFNATGAGILTGRADSFFQVQTRLSNSEMPCTMESTLEISRLLFRSIQWELNNASAHDLLNLRNPVSIDLEFVDRMTPLHGSQFLSDAMSLGRDKTHINSEWIVRDPNGIARYLNVQVAIPHNLQDCILVTLVDISERIRLEQELRNHVQSLEDRVQKRTQDIHVAHQKLQTESHQRQRLAEQVRENLVHITQGIISAKKIIEVALPGIARLKSVFPQSLVIERPRDILGGDFFHVHRSGQMDTLALLDSTGHGIPGAMVSLMGFTLLQHAITAAEDLSPQRILSLFHEAFCERMRTQSSDPQMHGFDAGVITLDRDRGVLRFAGAKEDLFHIRNGQCTVLRGSRCSIELFALESNVTEPPVFEEVALDVLPGDQFYLSTDGVRDQFGGPHNRKLGRGRLTALLARHSALPLHARKEAIQKDLLLWKGSHAKVDDATLIGFEI